MSFASSNPVFGVQSFGCYYTLYQDVNAFTWWKGLQARIWKLFLLKKYAIKWFKHSSLIKDRLIKFFLRNNYKDYQAMQYTLILTIAISYRRNSTRTVCSTTHLINLRIYCIKCHCGVLSSYTNWYLQRDKRSAKTIIAHYQRHECLPAKYSRLTFCESRKKQLIFTYIPITIPRNFTPRTIFHQLFDGQQWLAILSSHLKSTERQISCLAHQSSTWHLENPRNKTREGT